MQWAEVGPTGGNCSRAARQDSSSVPHDSTRRRFKSHSSHAQQRRHWWWVLPAPTISGHIESSSLKKEQARAFRESGVQPFE
jgi:hypothetical protein